MISRRKLCKSLGFSSMLAALPRFSSSETSAPARFSQDRSRIDLAGLWDRYITGTLYDRIEVPSSLHLFGSYELRRQVFLPSLGMVKRAILCLEAITYRAHIRVNSTHVGVMGPYTPYEFDVTDHIKSGMNEISVTIFDLQSETDGAGKDEIELGVNLGWEAYGGIIRDIFIETRPNVYIENVRIAYDLTKSLDTANCTATVFLSAAATGRGKFRLVVLDGETEVAGVQQHVAVSAGKSTAELKFTIQSPALWSPEAPHLYRVVVSLEIGSQETRCGDRYEVKTGFRKLVASGSNFYLNGKRLKLHGFSWLGTWKDQGFSLTRPQMAFDMRSIKETGCNFVRLHLFPQDRYMVELADELGLFVCEEPGFWQVNFSTARPSLADLGLDILARTIRRDWNSPSVFAWLLSNESDNTLQFLRKGREMCKELDPIQRFVSAANYRSASNVKSMFDQAGLDFYSDHPYVFDLHRFDEVCEQYGSDKPLLFDEWGGRVIGQSTLILSEQCDRILSLMEKDKLAGEVFFSWNDFPQFARIDAEMVDGIVESGVVSESRERRNKEYSQLTQLFRGQYQEQSLQIPSSSVQLVPLRRPPWAAGAVFQPIDLQAIAELPSMDRTWHALERDLVQFWNEDWMNQGEWDRIGRWFHFWKDAPIEILGAPFHCPIKDGYVRPLAVTPEFPDMQIPVGRTCTRLHILGQVTLPSGYPMHGTPGKQVAEYRIKYRSGGLQGFSLRNGLEVCTANLIHHASRIAPEPSIAQRAILYTKDPAREHYQVLLHTLEMDGSDAESITLSLLGQQFPLLLFAITAETR